MSTLREAAGRYSVSSIRRYVGCCSCSQLPPITDSRLLLTASRLRYEHGRLSIARTLSIDCGKGRFKCQNHSRDDRLYSQMRNWFTDCAGSLNERPTQSRIGNQRQACQYKHTPDHLIVIGTGVAGCATALVAAEKYKIPVSLLCAGNAMTDCNSYWAQGGIIYRNYDPVSGDSCEALMHDVITAGAELSCIEAVRKLATEGPDKVRELLLNEEGAAYPNVPFDRDESGALSFCLEASHSAPRIIHRADHTGKAITEHITQAAFNHPLIHVATDTIVADLITEGKSEEESFENCDTSNRLFRENELASRVCLGVHAYHCRSNSYNTLLTNRGVVIASGGLCGIYAHSTNPTGFNAIGSSVALASRAHVKCADLEYVQFHPTALNIPGEPCFLLTEALRGEGALLVNDEGHFFAKDFHPNGELAPRDVVARGVFAQMHFTDNGVAEGGRVFLDISHRDGSWLKRRFPTIHDRLLTQYGLDITTDMLPITPAAHYTCGGIVTDSQGRTSVSNLFAAGEAACTGLHGGNRLASTSLLEALVWGASVADFVGTSDSALLSKEWAREQIDCYSRSGIHSMTLPCSTFSPERFARNKNAAAFLFQELKTIMWSCVGVARSPSGLAQASFLLHDIQMEAEELFAESPNMHTIMLRDASLAGLQVARFAIKNKVSRGAHYVDERINGEQPISLYDRFGDDADRKFSENSMVV